MNKEIILELLPEYFYGEQYAMEGIELVYSEPLQTLVIVDKKTGVYHSSNNTTVENVGRVTTQILNYINKGI